MLKSNLIKDSGMEADENRGAISLFIGGHRGGEAVRIGDGVGETRGSGLAARFTNGA